MHGIPHRGSLFRAAPAVLRTIKGIGPIKRILGRARSPLLSSPVRNTIVCTSLLRRVFLPSPSFPFLSNRLHTRRYNLTITLTPQRLRYQRSRTRWRTKLSAGSSARSACFLDRRISLSFQKKRRILSSTFERLFLDFSERNYGMAIGGIGNNSSKRDILLYYARRACPPPPLFSASLNAY